MRIEIFSTSSPVFLDSFQFLFLIIFQKQVFSLVFTFFTDNIGALLITRIWGLVGPLFGNSSLERVRLKFEPSHQQNQTLQYTLEYTVLYIRQN